MSKLVKDMLVKYSKLAHERGLTAAFGGNFIPGVAFDLKKGRIGYGGGFYDRVLRNTQAFKIGVAFSFQIFEELPLEDHDQKVDIVITEKEIIDGIKNSN